MERYTEKQMEVFLRFYLDCKEKGFDSLRSEADKQRILLLGQGNKDLVEIFGGKLDGHQEEAYRLGKECALDKAATNRKAEEEKRKIDVNAAAMERQISAQHGRNKRYFFFQNAINSLEAEIQAANQAGSTAIQLEAMMNLSMQQKEKDYGTMGGIAAGITGSTAFGAAVAADKMRENAEIRRRNEEIRKANHSAVSSDFDASIRRVGVAKEKQRIVQMEADKVKLHLTQNRPTEELMGSLSFAQPEITFISGGSMLVRVNVAAKNTYKIAGEVPAVIDGSLIAEVFDGTDKVGEAYLNFPRDGVETTATLTGHCLNVKPGGDYTVIILPATLWLVEKYSPEKWMAENRAGIPNLYAPIPDLNDLFPMYQARHSWRSAKIGTTPWQQRLREREQEEIRALEKQKQEKIRAAEKEKAEKAKKKKKNILIGVAALVLVIVAVILYHPVSDYLAQQEAIKTAESYLPQTEEAIAMAEKNCMKAAELFTEIGISVEESGYTYNAFLSLENHVDEYSLLSGAEITELLSGDLITLSEYYHSPNNLILHANADLLAQDSNTWDVNLDGYYVAGYNETWEIEGDTLAIYMEGTYPDTPKVGSPFQLRAITEKVFMVVSQYGEVELLLVLQ